MERETTAVIYFVEKDSGVLRIKVGAAAEELRFSKFNFYSFGVQCTGHLTNILDVGQEVNVSYKLGPQTRPFIVAVWLGDKPDCSSLKSKAIYSEKGIIVHRDDVSITVKSDDSLVVINREVVYKDGLFLEKFDSLTPGQVISFDAVPDVHVCGAEYQGTCGWIGEPEPRIVDRFGLYVCDKDAEGDDIGEIDNLLGTVEVIPNEVVAFVSVCGDFVAGKVVLFRRSLDVECNTLREVLRVGDTLKLKLRCVYLSPLNKMWFVDRASIVLCLGDQLVPSIKTETQENSSCREVNNGWSEVMYPPCKKEEFSPVESCLKNSVENSSNVVGIPEIWIRDDSDEFEETEELEEPEKSEELEESEETEAVEEEESESVPFSKNFKCVPFKKSWCSCDSSFLLNWPANVSADKKIQKNVLVKHTFGNSSFDVNDPIVDKGTGIKKALKRLTGVKKGKKQRKVSFSLEAKSTNCEEFHVNRIWPDTITVLPELVFLKKELLNYSKSLSGKGKGYLGKIKSLPFCNCAIATVGEDQVPVLVRLQSLVTEEEISYGCTPVHMFLNEGVTVYVRVTHKTFAPGGERYFEAKRCWKVIKSTKPVENVENVQVLSWRSCWGSGNNLKKGRVLARDGQFIVMPDIEIDEARFFLNGSLAEPSVLKSFVGRFITYLVKSELQEKIATCAWVGKPPTPEVVLRDSLLVPQGLVDTNKYYEAVVADFPLPTHALCKIGVVPVLLPLPRPKGKRRVFQNVANPTLRIGSIITVSVSEKRCTPGISYVQSKVEAYEACYGKAVMVNFTGCVSKLPDPVGVIVTRGNLEVSFELCCVNAEGNFEDVYSWFEFVHEVLCVGSNVRFTAMRNVESGVVAVPYRAIEVWINEES